MPNKMLIDAAHPEETRVVVLRGNRVEEFDFESASKKSLRGNIYLAKVTRVEPSLQAAFIEYGGNRHGFLAFSEIHPDYYQIPVADRQALLEEEARAHREEDDDHRGGNGGGGNGNGNGNGRRSRRHRRGGPQQSSEKRAAQQDESVSEAIHEFREDGLDQIVESPLTGGSIEAEQPGLFEADDHERQENASYDNPVEAAEAGHDDLSSPGLPFDDEPRSSIAESVPSHEAGEGDPSTEGQDESANGSWRAEALDGVEDVSVEAHVSHEIIAGDDAAGADDSFDHDEADIDEEHDADEAASSTHARRGEEPSGAEEGDGEDEAVEQLGGDALEDVSYRTPRLRRHYKIQEVIKRRQVLLVQVVKEERGNKGAALTTYLSLAGRYSVLMPNTARGGGISRKITDADDRKRLKSIAQELEVPEGMGIILRTAGAARSESEVTRDFEYLLRMWETVRELTLRSSAPMLVYEEGSLIKRAIRDLYTKDIDEVSVAGEEGYREAKDFMRLLMPTHAKNVQLYRDPQPIFAKAGADAQLDAMFSNQVTLRSGGYLVINQTEALVAIDVNSGRSTREHNIEDTALRTNLEAADEVARQLRLRDLAGLIVVDFIDMEESRNNRSVERRIKDALKNDRARIQIGRISHFGLLEMSRQRIRTGVLEGSTVLCPHCAGAGTVRSTSSIALHVLRALEDTLIRSAAYNLIVRTRMEVALYILNQKRAHLMDLEQRFGVAVAVMADTSLTGTIYHALERGEAATPPPAITVRHPGLGQNDGLDDAEDIEAEIEEELEEVPDPQAEPRASRRNVEDEQRSARADGDDPSGEKRRKRRRRRRGRDRDQRAEAPSEGGDTSSFEEGETPSFESEDVFVGDEAIAARADDRVEASGVDAGEASLAAHEMPDAETEPVPVPDSVSVVEMPVIGDSVDDAPSEVIAPARRRRSRRSTSRTGATAALGTDSASEGAVDGGEASDAPAIEAVPAPRRSRRTPRSRVVADDAPSLIDFDRPSADRDVGADTAKNHAESEPPAAVVEESLMAPVVVASAPEPDKVEAASSDPSATDAPTAPVAEAPSEPETPAEPEPARAKRSGWWQRAKATITGE